MKSTIELCFLSTISSLIIINFIFTNNKQYEEKLKPFNNIPDFFKNKIEKEKLLSKKIICCLENNNIFNLEEFWEVIIINLLKLNKFFFKGINR